MSFGPHERQPARRARDRFVVARQPDTRYERLHAAYRVSHVSCTRKPMVKQLVADPAHCPDAALFSGPDTRWARETAVSRHPSGQGRAAGRLQGIVRN
jgi:hypothetical protein